MQRLPRSEANSGAPRVFFGLPLVLTKPGVFVLVILLQCEVKSHRGQTKGFEVGRAQN